jgi:hypothetical protein
MICGAVQRGEVSGGGRFSTTSPTGRINVCVVNVSSRDKLDDLLARGRLSAPRRERIFEEVDRHVRWRRAARYAMVAAPLALAAGLALLVRPHDAGPDPYAPKGTLQSHVELGCSGGELFHCPTGSKLIFRLDALKEAGFLHAYAEPLDPGRERVWYYPTMANPSPHVEAASGAQIMGQGIVVGPEHVPGRYRVHLVVAPTPLSREDLLADSLRNVVAADVVEMVIVEP